MSTPISAINISTHRRLAIFDGVGRHAEVVLLAAHINARGVGVDHLQAFAPCCAQRRGLCRGGWAVEPAETGSVRTDTLKGFGWLEGRYPRTPLGDTFLWTKRSAAKPNRLSQPVQHLRPGQLYSLRLVTADYQELQQGKSAPQKHAVSVQVVGAEAIPQKSFQQVVANNYAHRLGPFNDQNKAWLNYHYQVFRAKGRMAELTISGWASPTQPGGPVGQEPMYNFVELQPYLAD